MLLLPLAFQTKPHLVDPTGTFRVWLTDPPGMLDSLAEGSTFSTELAQWLTGEATDAMLEHGRSRGTRRFVFVHDWRGARAYDTAARLRIIGWGRRFVGQIERIDIALAEDAPTFFRMAVAGGTMTMSLLGVPCAVAKSLDDAVAKTGVRPAKFDR